MISFFYFKIHLTAMIELYKIANTNSFHFSFNVYNSGILYSRFSGLTLTNEMKYFLFLLGNITVCIEFYEFFLCSPHT